MQKGTYRMKRSILQIICKGCKNIQRMRSKALRSLVGNVKIVSIKIEKMMNIFQTTFISNVANYQNILNRDAV